MAMICALPVPWLDNFRPFAFFMWFLLFFGGFILPPLTGIMLNSVEEHQRTSANSLANLAYNLFGYLPAPSFYGLISSLTGGKKSRWSLTFLLYSTIPTVSLLFWSINKKLRNEEIRKMMLPNNPDGGTGGIGLSS